MSTTFIGEILLSDRCVGGSYIYTLNNIIILFATEYFFSVFTEVGIHSLL